MKESYVFLENTDKFLITGYVQNKELNFLNIFEKNKNSLVGNIYRGRVIKKVDALKAAFVDIGEEKNGFLQPESNLYRDLQEGKEIIVQVKTDANQSEDKGPGLELKYELSGKNFVLKPFENKIFISKKIRDIEKKHELFKLVEDVLKNNYGAIIRTGAEKASLKDLENELNHLVGIHESLSKEKNYSPTPKLLIENNPYEKVLLDFKCNEFITNDKKTETRLKEISEEFNIVYDEKFSCKYDSFLYGEIKKAFLRKVNLKNGIELVFDKTEAFNVIDVNSRSYLKHDLEKSSFYFSNYDSYKEILRQITLRNLTGIILVDFLKFKSEKSQEEFLEKFKEYSNKFYNPVKVAGFSNLGILELTRKKTFMSETFEEIDFNKIW